MKLFFAYLKEHVRLIAAFVLAAVIFAVSFALYKLPLSAVAYPAALCLVPALVFAIIDFYRVKRRHAEFLSLTEITAAEEKLLENPWLFRAPIVRNGRQATAGYCPEVWQTWE